jgi:hypothetical protein
MCESERANLGYAALEDLELGIAFGDLDLPMAFETTVIVDEIANPVPQFHRRDGERDFGHMAPQAPHPARVDARGMTTSIILLKNCDLGPTTGKMKCGRTAMQAAADDDYIGETGGQ